MCVRVHWTVLYSYCSLILVVYLECEDVAEEENEEDLQGDIEVPETEQLTETDLMTKIESLNKDQRPIFEDLIQKIHQREAGE